MHEIKKKKEMETQRAMQRHGGPCGYVTFQKTQGNIL